MSFRWKLFLSYLVLAFLLAGSLLFYINRMLEQQLVEASRSNLMNQARLAMMQLEAAKSDESRQKIAERLGGVSHDRVTLIAPDGRVWGDSDVRGDQVASLENHKNRPEVQQALQTGSGSALRYSDTLGTNMLYVAIASRNADGVILRMALPLKYLDQAKAGLHRVLGLAGLMVLALAIVFSVLLSRLTTRPLREMAESAAKIGVGERHARVPVTGKDEVGYLARVLNEMADRIDQHVKEMTEEQRRLDTILRGMGEGVMVLDPVGVITLVNPAFRGQFNLSGNLEGRFLPEVSRHPDLLGAFEEQQKEGKEIIREVTIPATGQVFSTHWVPLGNNQGTVAVFHDISDLKRTEAIRRDFVANVSHELRTPVAVIKGYAETLLDGALNDEPGRGRHFVKVIAEHAERLSNLINDILALSKLENRDTALELAALDLGGVIRKNCQLLDEHARQKGIEIRINCPEQLPEVLADQGKLEQVLLNLLDNAIKYTQSPGQVTVSATEAGDRVAISVADTGMGIPAKDLSRIFERFYRVDESRSRDQGGTGLGLAIVKHIVQLHGGEMQVKSEPGKGSTFTVLLKSA
jgi:two-component system, OmpR family, phosphate regulon sensor histidine kinase PhoR